MEKGFSLSAEIREKVGTKQAARLRKEGKIPAIVYGHKQEAVAIALNKHAFVEGLHHGHRLMDIKVGKKTEKILIKDVQYDHLSRDVIHVDLMRVSMTETVKVSVPIELKGTAKGTHEGGVITAHSNTIEVECKVTEIPEGIVVSVKDLEIGDTIHAKDLVMPEGVKLVSDPAMLLVSCSVVAELKPTEELEVEAPAAPEVITEKKVEEGAEAAAEGEKAVEKKGEKAVEKKSDKKAGKKAE